MNTTTASSDYLEKVKFEIKVNLSFPNPRVAYKKPNVCVTQPTQNPPKLENPLGNTNATNRFYQGYNGEQYNHHDIMDPDGNYHLFWRFDDDTITFEIQAKAKGWVGLGFSPNGGMAGADIVHAYIDTNGAAQLSVSCLLVHI